MSEQLSQQNPQEYPEQSHDLWMPPEDGSIQPVLGGYNEFDPFADIPDNTTSPYHEEPPSQPLPEREPDESFREGNDTGGMF